MTVNKRPVLLLSLILMLPMFLLVDVFRFSAPQDQLPTPTFTPEPTQSILVETAVEQRIQLLETRVDSLETFVEIQSNSYSAAISRSESNINVMLAVMAVASVLVAILGFGVVRLWVNRLVEERITKMTSERIQAIVNDEVEKARRNWDHQFAELYEEYRSIKNQR